MSDFDIPIGATGEADVTVTPDLTPREPGIPPVYSTPMMIWLMEIASARAIQPFLPTGSTSVGTEVNVRHLAATPVGFIVKAISRVTAVNGRIVTFSVEAHDGVELIGEGIHTRAVIDVERFNKRVAAKSAK